jgi:hypothetical protein
MIWDEDFYSLIGKKCGRIKAFVIDDLRLTIDDLIADYAPTGTPQGFADNADLVSRGGNSI